MAGEAMSSISATEGILSEHLELCQGRGGDGSDELGVHGRIRGDGVGAVGYNTAGAETEVGWLSRRAEPWAS